MKIGIKYLSDKYGNGELKKPAYATDGSAGMDLPACIDEAVILNPGDRMAIPTGMAIELPSPDYVAYIFACVGGIGDHSLSGRYGSNLYQSDGSVFLDYHVFRDDSVRCTGGCRCR